MAKETTGYVGKDKSSLRVCFHASLRSHGMFLGWKRTGIPVVKDQKGSPRLPRCALINNRYLQLATFRPGSRLNKVENPLKTREFLCLAR